MKSLFSVKEEQLDNFYTHKINIPQYEPKNICPNISELYNLSKYGNLMRNIKSSNITEDEKKFLQFASSRHIVFNYAKIADYYAHATPEMQRLMEESALVILDVDDAIANGYIKLSSDIKNIMKNSGEKPKNEK